LNRKDIKPSSGGGSQGRGAKRGAQGKAIVARRRFVLSSASRKERTAPETNGNGKHAHGKNDLKNPAKAVGVNPTVSATHTSRSGIDLTETIKTLLHLAQEHGYVTYDDINDVLPDGLNPEDLDELFSKLRSLDVEIVDQAEVQRTKQPEPEEEEDSRLEILDDPVRMYMNQMGKVPLLTREQEVEICKRIEDAELEMKRLVYGLGFTAKEHIATAEKLLSEPPKERFDRIVVDKRSRHGKAI